MSKPLPDSQLNAIVSVVEKHAGSATLLDIAFALNPPPPLRNVQRWLSALVNQKRLIRKGSNKGARYELPSRSAESVSPVLSAEGAAIQCLVNQPLELRAAADYRRLSLESYVPNRTWYLPAEVRARLRATHRRGSSITFDKDSMTRLYLIVSLVTAAAALVVPAAFAIAATRSTKRKVLELRARGIYPEEGCESDADVEGLKRAGEMVLAVRCYRAVHQVSLADARAAVFGQPKQQVLPVFLAVVFLHLVIVAYVISRR